MRSESSCAMTSAATFLPAKLTEPASGDRQGAVNFGAADRTVTAATVVRSVAERMRFIDLSYPGWMSSSFPSSKRHPRKTAPSTPGSPNFGFAMRQLVDDGVASDFQ